MPRSMRTPAMVALLALAGCANSEEPRARQLWVPDGDPVTCISSNRIRSFEVVNDQAINFMMNGRRVFRNDLPFRCAGLSFGSTIRHNSRTMQLCSVDTITVVRPGGAPDGPTCSLGRFQPLKAVPAPAG